MTLRVIEEFVPFRIYSASPQKFGEQYNAMG